MGRSHGRSQITSDRSKALKICSCSSSEIRSNSTRPVQFLMTRSEARCCGCVSKLWEAKIQQEQKTKTTGHLYFRKSSQVRAPLPRAASASKGLPQRIQLLRGRPLRVLARSEPWRVIRTGSWRAFPSGRPSARGCFAVLGVEDDLHLRPEHIT